MSLKSLIGKSLLHFEIVAKLGQGGMGEVYRARDTKLGRDVAIKVLPAEFVADPERLARFQREASVLAAMSHPNIAAIHQVDEVDGVHFLVMELAEGATLTERIAGRPMPLDEAVTVAIGICRALDAAHAQGIVHRDLKPDNVKVAADGQVKVLDFGLAKSWDLDRGDSTRLSMSPTVTAQMTMGGMILGTASYMSPEQARGKPVDHRSDLWSFGCVLFEMITGHQAFAGETATDILGAIVHKEPNWDVIPHTTPPAVVRVLERCLTKDADDRLHAAADARIELERGGRDVPPVVLSDPLPHRPAWWTWAALFAGIALGLVGARWLLPASAPATEPMRQLSINVEPLAERDAGPVLARDGSFMVYAGVEPPQLYVRRLDQRHSVPIPGTEGARAPILSPDEKWVAFGVGGQLKKIPLSGGRATLLHDGSPAWVRSTGGDWGRDGSIYVSVLTGGYRQLFRVPQQGGQPEPLQPTPAERQPVRDRLAPQLLPGEERLLYPTILGDKFYAAAQGQLAVMDLADGTETVLLEPAGIARYLGRGQLLVATGPERFELIELDPETLETRGPGIPLAERILTRQNGFEAILASSDDGTFVFEPLPEEVDRDQLVWLDFDGDERPAATERRRYQAVTLAPDGTRAAIVDRDPSGSAYLGVYDLEQDRLSTLTTGAPQDRWPVWTPDGKSLIFLRVQDGAEPALYRIPVDAGAEPERLMATGTIWVAVTDVSPDGRHVLGFRWSPETDKDWDIWFAPVDGQGELELFAREPTDELHPRFSPDGRWVAFVSTRTGREEVYLKRFPEAGGWIQVSENGGRVPVWSHDGRELYYVDGNNARLLQVSLSESDPPRLGKPRAVVSLPASLRPFSWNHWGEMSPDGKRLLLVRREQGHIDQLGVVLRLFEGIEAAND